MIERPNILLVHAHDMGRYNQAYGHATPTPNMRRFAGEGMVLRDAHCAAPTCSPSRAAMFTGLTAHETGMLGLVHRGFDLGNRDLHLARRLSAAGYHTAQAGLQHEYDASTGEPVYDEVLEVKEYGYARDLEAARDAAGFLARSQSEKPWFLWLGLFYPHRPFPPANPERDNPQHIQVPPPLPDTEAVRRDMAGYHAAVALADEAFGIVLDALDREGLRDNTLVILTTDHGIAFPDMKCNLTSHGTGVTWLMRFPGVIPANSASDSLASHLDLVPTVLDLAGVPVPEGLHGHSLRPLFSNPSAEIRGDLFAEINVHASMEPQRMVRTKKALYIRLFDDDPRRPMANVDGGETKEVWVEAGWERQPRDSERLYDLIFDPQERHNLAESPANRELCHAMGSRLRAWMERTNDPLLNGGLHLPKGTKLNPRDEPDPHGCLVEV